MNEKYIMGLRRAWIDLLDDETKKKLEEFERTKKTIIFEKGPIVTDQEGDFSVKLEKANTKSEELERIDVYLMKKSIIQRVLKSKELELDIYQSLYFAIIYSLFILDDNKEMYYENYVPSNVTEETRKKLTKNCVNYFKKPSGYKEKFEIIWKEQPAAEKESILKRELWNIASNVNRLWINEEKLRGIVGNRPKHSKRRLIRYLHDEIDSAAMELELDMGIADYWVLEQLLGFNTSYTLYSQLRPVFENCTAKNVGKVKDKYIDIYTMLKNLVICNTWDKSLSIKENFVAILEKLTKKIDVLENEIFGKQQNTDEKVQRKYPLLETDDMLKNTKPTNDALKGIIFTKVISSLETIRNE